MDIEYDAVAEVMIFRPVGEVSMPEILSAMARYFDTPGARSNCGGIWHFRRANVVLSYAEVEAFTRPLRPISTNPRRTAHVAILVARETDRVILLECKRAAGLTTDWKFFDNFDAARRWASRSPRLPTGPPVSTAPGSNRA